MEHPFWDKSGFGYGALTPRDLYAVDTLLAVTRQAILTAFAKHPPAHSTHEILGQLAEEMDEFVDAVRADNSLECTNELRDVAVVAVRGMLEIHKWKGGVRKP